jgi:hypothetical protein
MAHEPANAAPNTSAPIRMAALMTVMTLSQLMRLPSAMRVPFARRNLSESGFEIKSIAQRPSARIVTGKRRAPALARASSDRGIVNAGWSGECRAALAASWRECGHPDRPIKALAKQPVSD